MAVDNKHPQYQENVEKWTKCRICVQGEEAVKATGESHLPRIGGHTTDEYNAYVKRAQFYGGTARTKDAFVGMMFRKDPAIDAAEQNLKELDDIGKGKESITNLLRECVEEAIITGRTMVLVDADEQAGSNPYLTTYDAEDLINWNTEIDKDGKIALSLAVLKEEYMKEGDRFDTKTYPQLRVLYLDEGIYTVTIYRRKQDMYDKSAAAAAAKDDWDVHEEIVPQIRGKKLDFIPLVVMGTTTISTDVSKPPLLDVANVNLSLYRTSADLEHGRHFTALPTGYIAGGKIPKGTQFYLGSSRFLQIPDSQVKLDYLEFTGAGLKSLSEAVKEKKDEMATLGARILEHEKAGVEAAETTRLRKSGESSILSTIAGTVSDGFNIALEWWKTWKGIQAEVTVQINSDFLDTIADVATLQFLLLGVQSNSISWQTFYYNLQKAELTPKGQTPEQEIEYIDAGGPMGPPNEDNDGNELPEEEEEDDDNKGKPKEGEE